MILEKETFEKFGYYSYDLKQKSRSKVVTICDDCGNVRIVPKYHYHALCVSCAQKGEKSHRWKGGPIMRICEQCGVKFPAEQSNVERGGGKFCSPKCYGKWKSKLLKGENNPRWQGGISFEPYCSKFNNEFKEKIRDKFGRICFLCSKTEEDNGKRLSVHHVNYNKNCGCDGDETCQFVPLCVGCNSKVNKNRDMWEAKIIAKMKNTLNGWYKPEYLPIS